MSEPPNAGCYGDGRHEEERHEDEEPEVVSSRHAVAHQHLEHQQQDVEAHRDQHGFELHAGLTFGPDRTTITLNPDRRPLSHKRRRVAESLPVLGVVRPDSSPHGGPDDDQQLPQPYRGEHRPVAPLDDSIEPQGQQDGEQQQAGVDQELTATEERNV